jgi:hypothetical protein
MLRSADAAAWAAVCGEAWDVEMTAPTQRHARLYPHAAT